MTKTPTADDASLPVLCMVLSGYLFASQILRCLFLRADRRSAAQLAAFAARPAEPWPDPPKPEPVPVYIVLPDTGGAP